MAPLQACCRFWVLQIHPLLPQCRCYLLSAALQRHKYDSLLDLVVSRCIVEHDANVFTKLSAHASLCNL
jgi:hypothetical protein